MDQPQPAVLLDRTSAGHPDRPRDLVDEQGNGQPMRLPAADILRGLAALWVFLFHAKEGRHLETLVQALPEGATQALFSAGHLGVAVFFVLSGLVIAMSGERCGDSLLSAKNFLLRRLVRLCPPYYFSIAVALAFLLIKRSVEATDAGFPSLGDIGAHLLFLQDLLRIDPLNSVYWTLCIEVQFYVLFCALMLLVRWLRRQLPPKATLVLVMASACVAAAPWPLGIAADDATWHATFLPTWHLFLLGVLLHHALTPGRFLVVPYFAYLIFLAVAGARDGNAFTLAGVATSLALYVCAGWKNSSAWKKYRLLTNLGLVSYSLYLLHNPITGAAFSVTRRLLGNGIGPELVGLTLSLSLCIIGAAVSYVAIERPAIRWGRRLKA